MPLAIWPVAQTTAQWQRAGRYLPDCIRHPGKMLPELARRIVTEYSDPGALVVDPLAGIGTTVVEAALLDRRAIGVGARRALGRPGRGEPRPHAGPASSAGGPRSATATPATSPRSWASAPARST